jgi:hypothetical protein
MIKYWPRQGGVLVPWIQVERRWSVERVHRADCVASVTHHRQRSTTWHSATLTVSALWSRLALCWLECGVV